MRYTYVSIADLRWRLNAISALGLGLHIAEPESDEGTDTEPAASEPIRLADYPQLRRIAWHLGEFTEVTPQEALNLYERATVNIANRWMSTSSSPTPTATDCCAKR